MSGKYVFTQPPVWLRQKEKDFTLEEITLSIRQSHPSSRRSQKTNSGNSLSFSDLSVICAKYSLLMYWMAEVYNKNPVFDPEALGGIPFALNEMLAKIPQGQDNNIRTLVGVAPLLLYAGKMVYDAFTGK